MEITAQLKTETQELHSQVEETLPFFRPDFNLAQYQNFLHKQILIYEACERVVQRSEYLQNKRYAKNRFGKTNLLKLDLETLGETGRAPPPGEPIHLDFSTTESSILGVCYVLEGASLGGQIIAQLLFKRFGLLPNYGAAFYNGYGIHQMEMWRSFQDFLISVTSSPEHPGIICAARQTFGFFNHHLRA